MEAATAEEGWVVAWVVWKALATVAELAAQMAAEGKGKSRHESKKSNNHRTRNVWSDLQSAHTHVRMLPYHQTRTCTKRVGPEH